MSVAYAARPVLLHRCPTCGAWSKHIVEAGPLVIDLRAQTVTVDGRPVSLTFTEWSILAVLSERHGEPVSISRILARFPKGYYDAHWVRVNIARIRGKLAPHGAWIVNRPRYGYLLHRETADAPGGPPQPARSNGHAVPLNGRWSLQNPACVCCGRTDLRHHGRGLCTGCHAHARKAERTPAACHRQGAMS